MSTAALDAGAALGPRTIASISPEHMKTLAVVLDDPNPIHLDPKAVRALGLGDRVVNQGPANLGYLLDLLHEVAPTGRVADVRVRFMANVFGGDRVTAAGRVEAVEGDADARRLRCAIWLDVDGGARALEGTATLIVPTTTTPEHD